MPGTVTVACKLPHGLILQLYRMEDHSEQVMGGGSRTVQRAVAEHAPVRLNGSGKKHGEEAPHEIRHAAGLTFGVDADFFATWVERNKDMEIVKNGLVFAHERTRETTARARDHQAIRTGLERLDPNNLPAEFKGKIKTADVA